MVEVVRADSLCFGRGITLCAHAEEKVEFVGQDDAPGENGL